jgi:hypothetical protein
MGATNIHYEFPLVDAGGREVSAKDAYNQLVDEALSYYGSDPYSGTIATCELGNSMIAPQTEDEYDDLLDRIDKREVRYYKNEEANRWVFIGWAAC